MTTTARSDPSPRHRPCAWCAGEIAVVHRPGRPRIYCNHACRQRAYEHRHGFRHTRTVRPLPGQAAGDTWRGSGYERGGFGFGRGKVHAMRTSVRPEGRLRETLCGALVAPVPGQHFTPVHPAACAVCTTVVERNPLQRGVSASNELARVRALLDEVHERRVPPGDAMRWLHANAPTQAGSVAGSGVVGVGGTGASSATNTRSR